MHQFGQKKVKDYTYCYFCSPSLWHTAEPLFLPSFTAIFSLHAMSPLPLPPLLVFPSLSEYLLFFPQRLYMLSFQCQCPLGFCMPHILARVVCPWLLCQGACLYSAHTTCLQHGTVLSFSSYWGWSLCALFSFPTISILLSFSFFPPLSRVSNILNSIRTS